MDVNIPEISFRIHALIAKAIATSDREEFEEAMSDLRTALRDHTEWIREMATLVLTSGSEKSKDT